MKYTAPQTTKKSITPKYVYLLRINKKMYDIKLASIECRNPTHHLFFFK